VAGVFPPGAIPTENRKAIFKALPSRGIRVTMKATRKKALDDDEEF
jgi:hypothetical protein